MNNLLIIGNGFDLAHDMKTSYNHFIEYLINKLCSENILSEHILAGIYVKNYTDLIMSFKTNSFHPRDFKNKFVGVLLSEMSIMNWCDIESKYFDLLKEANEKGSLYRNPLALNTHFEFVRKNLGDYLCTQGKGAKAIESYKIMFSLIDSNETTILNFNYTNTLQDLYSNEIKDSKVIHIHGELLNYKNPMIFGYAANDEESRELIDKNDNEYMRNIKKHLYKRTNNEELIINYLDGTEIINVTILGHSCGLSDKLILNQILNHKNIKSINISYYEQYEHYFQTQVNIDRIMNKDEHFTKLVDFNSSHRMPQHNDTDEQVQGFTQYIEPIISKRKEARTKHKLFQSNNVVR